MPRRIDDDDEMPRRRRRSAKAAAIEAEEERGLVMRVLLHSPKDIVVTLSAPQAAVVNPLPRPRPVVEAEPPEPKLVEVRGADSRQVDLRNADARNADARNPDAMTNLVVKSTSAPATTAASVLRPPAPIPVTAQSAGARRVAAVQRTLTQYGYGQLKPTGAVGSDTQAAISKFERERKLPVTGQMSDRLVRELTAMVGHPIE